MRQALAAPVMDQNHKTSGLQVGDHFEIFFDRFGPAGLKESQRLSTAGKSLGAASQAAKRASQGARCGSSTLRTWRAPLSAAALSAASACQRSAASSAIRLETKRQRRSLHGQAR